MIHIFHGFLGSPDDFAFLRNPNVVLHDLTKKTEIQISSEDVFIGYSMGGRIAIELAVKLNFNIKKLVLISSHPGLIDSERETRADFERLVLEKLHGSSSEQFLSWWNTLPIFQGDTPISVTENRFAKIKGLFERHRLSAQENFLPEITRHADRILYIVGTNDEKYLNIAMTRLAPVGVTIRTIAGGHRLFQKPEELMKILIEEKVL